MIGSDEDKWVTQQVDDIYDRCESVHYDSVKKQPVVLDRIVVYNDYLI